MHLRHVSAPLRVLRVPVVLLPIVLGLVLTGCGSDAPVSIHDPHPISTPGSDAAPDDDPESGSTGVRIDADTIGHAVAASRAQALLQSLPAPLDAPAASTLFETDLWPVLDQPLLDAAPQLHAALESSRSRRAGTSAAVATSTTTAALVSTFHDLAIRRGATTQQVAAGTLDGVLLAIDVDAQRLLLPKQPGASDVVTPDLLRLEIATLPALVNDLPAGVQAQVQTPVETAQRRLEAFVSESTPARADAVETAVGAARDAVDQAAGIDTAPADITSVDVNNLTDAQQALTTAIALLRATPSTSNPTSLRAPRTMLDRSGTVLAGVAPIQLGQLRSCLGQVDSLPVRAPAAAATSLEACAPQLDALRRLAAVDLQSNG